MEDKRTALGYNVHGAPKMGENGGGKVGGGVDDGGGDSDMEGGGVNGTA